ncbi:MAG TPA: heavy-metal-associated domain-containing protein [Chitinophagales bacterium]|nr:heavy-metal-associated domain-containing protein [Chitinophagales bacterium]
MTTESIFIANLKCNGCATTIKTELLKLQGVQTVTVDNDKDEVTVSYDNIGRDIITGRLHQLGYPEATDENGLLLQLKSLSSCMIGRINNSIK